MRAGDRVYVSTRYNKFDKHEGIIHHLEMAPINRAIPRGDQTEHIYVRFNDSSVYRRWLKRGSPIMVNSEKHVILEINDYNDSLVVARDDGTYMINPIERNIKPNAIDSMLIWREGYVLEN
jgi:hypothetical protein